MSVNDYAYCETCEEGFDYWKYEDLKDAGHDRHSVRNATEAELLALIVECDETGCFDESFLDSGVPYRHEPLAPTIEQARRAIWGPVLMD